MRSSRLAAVTALSWFTSPRGSARCLGAAYVPTEADFEGATPGNALEVPRHAASLQIAWIDSVQGVITLSSRGGAAMAGSRGVRLRPGWTATHRGCSRG